jgi:hypothetical protein
MLFAKRVFFWAGVYGIAVLAPNFFLEKKVGVDIPPPITHPEYFYGFVCLALAFQVLFLMIARDPVRFRPMMIPSMLEKFGFAATCAVLFALGRLNPVILVPAGLDLTLGILFIAAWIKTPVEG